MTNEEQILKELKRQKILNMEVSTEMSLGG